MKTLAAFAALLLAAGQLSAQTPPTTTTTTTTPTTTTAPTGTKASDVKPTDSKSTTTTTTVKKDDKKKPAPEPIIPGVNIPRANGTYLSLEVVDGNFKLSFYDKKKKLMTPDVTRATARWPNLRSVAGDNRTVLNSSGNALVGQKTVVPPLNFIIHLTLLQGEGDEAKAVETYTVQFHG